MYDKENRAAGFLRPLINAYSALPLHGMTAIPGKISGALMVADAIEDAVSLIHGPIGCSFQRKINPLLTHTTLRILSFSNIKTNSSAFSFRFCKCHPRKGYKKDKG
jgi:nitrogenase molybdenum-iron protein alpha/beta subunit